MTDYDAIFAAFPKPPCATLLGWRLVDARPDDGWARFGFEARQEFLNPAGFVQGGMLSAMLDDTMGPTVLLNTQGRLYTVTIDMRISFIAPARVGAFFGEGQVVNLGGTIGFVEGRLMDAEDRLIAKASASVRLIESSKLK